MKLELPHTVDLNNLAISLGVTSLAARNALKIALENIILLDQKQHDYGSRNISSHGAFGCVVRMDDKMARLSNLYSKKRRKAINEPILDSFRDLSNYAIIAMLVETNKWPNE